jgi:hypothetical protein
MIASRSRTNKPASHHGSQGRGYCTVLCIQYCNKVGHDGVNLLYITDTVQYEHTGYTLIIFYYLLFIVYCLLFIIYIL